MPRISKLFYVSIFALILIALTSSRMGSAAGPTVAARGGSVKVEPTVKAANPPGLSYETAPVTNVFDDGIAVNSFAQSSGGTGNCTLGEAIEAANTNAAVAGCSAGSASGADTIQLPAGTYTLTTVDNTDVNGGNGLPQIAGTTIIQGAGADTTIIERSSAAATPDFRLFYLASPGNFDPNLPRLTLNGVTVRNGKIPGGKNGGAIHARDGRIEINNCRFENNTAAGFGGAIVLFVSDSPINNSTFTGNTSGASGGAISAGGGVPITNSTFTNNTADTNNTASGGGAIAAGFNSIVTITGSTFTGNTVSGIGPGGAIRGHNINVFNSILNGNSAPDGGSNSAGGAISGVTVAISNCTISGNTTGGGGGGINGDNVTVTDSTVSGNTGNYGGGIHANNVTVNNSTVSGNRARESGGGVTFSGSNGSLSLNNATITNNTADSDNNGSGDGGGLHHSFSFSPSQTISIRNTLIAGNINGGAPDCSGATFLSQGYNLIGNNTGCNFTAATGDQVGTSSTPIDPLLGSLANNGGPTQTHALLGGSPAIDTANPATPDGTGNSCLPSDQRGAIRPGDGDGNGTPRCDIGAFEIVPPDQTITFNALANKTFGDSPFNVSASSSSGLPVSFSIVSGPATISGTTITITGVGVVTVRASQAGDANFNAATSVDRTFTVAKANQTIAFNPLSGKTHGDTPFTISATATSGLPVSFSIVSGPATISGNTITITGVGTVTVRASQAGDANYNAATPVDQSFTVNKANQTITFNALANKTFGDAPFNVSATSSSGLPVSFSIVSGPATISGNTITITGVGVVTVRASQAGDANFNAGTSVDRTFTVAKANQTITFNALADKSFGDAPFTISATATSGLPVSFSILSGPASVSGNTVTITGVGTVTVRASQAGDANYNAATPVDQSFTVNKANQTITFNALANKTFGDAPFNVSASSSSGLPLSFSIVSGPATISGNTITITGVGVVTVRASQAGDANYNAATSVDRSFTVEPATFQTVVLTADQVEIKTWTFQGRTYAYLKLSFPNAGYRVANWGQAVRAGNDFSADAAVEKFTGASVQAVTTTAQIYDLGPLADGNYTFTFKNSSTVVKSQAFTVSSATPPPNPIDNAREFVKQQYRDFLNREADQAGEDFWTDNITKCSDPARRPPGQTEAQCTLRQRETTSGAFFLSPEFQYTGYYVYRMYQGALGRQPKLSEFTPDALFVGAGIVVNGQLSAAKINQNKADFAQQFVNCTDATKYRCAEFKATYDGLNNQQYVDKLFQTTGVNASASDRTALVNGLNANPATETRAGVLQKVVDGILVIAEGNQQFTTTYGQAFYNSEFNEAFVELEYFGYMKRDPDDAGYAFWLGKLNLYGNFVDAEMVLAFISSPEYRARFGQP